MKRCGLLVLGQQKNGSHFSIGKNRSAEKELAVSQGCLGSGDSQGAEMDPFHGAAGC